MSQDRLPVPTTDKIIASLPAKSALNMAAAIEDLCARHRIAGCCRCSAVLNKRETKKAEGIMTPYGERLNNQLAIIVALRGKLVLCDGWVIFWALRSAFYDRKQSHNATQPHDAWAEQPHWAPGKWLSDHRRNKTCCDFFTMPQIFEWKNVKNSS